MSSANQFNTFAGEVQTNINTFPARFIFGSTEITPLMSDFTFKMDGELNPKVYIQAGPGMSTYTPNVRKFDGSLTIPVRITEAKVLEDIANKMIDYSFFDNSKLPQVPKFFQVETGFYKTASGYLVPPGEYDYDYNKDVIQILVDRCITSGLTVSSEAGSPTTMSINFAGTIDKNPRKIINTDASTLSSVKSSFDINRVLGYH